MPRRALQVEALLGAICGQERERGVSAMEVVRERGVQSVRAPIGSKQVISGSDTPSPSWSCPPASNTRG